MNQSFLGRIHKSTFSQKAWLIVKVSPKMDPLWVILFWMRPLKGEENHLIIYLFLTQDMTNPYIKAVSRASKRSLALGTQVIAQKAKIVKCLLFFRRNGWSLMTLSAPSKVRRATPLSSLWRPVDHTSSPAQTDCASQLMKGINLCVSINTQCLQIYAFF